MAKRSAYRKGDIIVVDFPYSDFSGAKRRPALVIGASEEHVIVAFITTKKTGPQRWLVPISATPVTGVVSLSYIRCDKLLAVDVRVIGGGIGVADRSLMLKVDAKLRRLLSL